MTPDMYLVLPLYGVCAALGLNALVGVCAGIVRAIRDRRGAA